ncbi:hypothetical protein HYI36_25350 [Bacillus sp. Gen3]|uniref:hypothetical protein n=1 Tax=Heyndrickxia oleronia TaxID=38875 RepID=UPI0015D145FA|nr:hypothetical protein [Heyndrickxia oleronia]MBU5211090.1 hypothetical protein [Heyndrickxia oleronia]NYV68595.1 hypothetical protein [Bacillus sp. Gen3]
MIELIKSIFEKIFNLDTNVSDFEKMVNGYKLSRKKYLFLILILLFYVVIITTLSYLIAVKLGGGVKSFALFMILLCMVFFVGIKKPQTAGLLIAYLVLPIFLLSTIVNFFIEGLDIANVIFSLMLLGFISILFGSVYLFAIEKLTFTTNHKLTFVFDDSTTLEATLVSVTKNGDYIISNKENEEMLLNKDFIKRVIYNKESE